MLPVSPRWLCASAPRKAIAAKTRRDSGSGPKVPPGTYTVMVKFKDHEAKGTVQVATDPYTKNTDADWQARESALNRLATLQAAAVKASEGVAYRYPFNLRLIS